MTHTKNSVRLDIFFSFTINNCIPNVMDKVRAMTFMLYCTLHLNFKIFASPYLMLFNKSNCISGHLQIEFKYQTKISTSVQVQCLWTIINSYPNILTYSLNCKNMILLCIARNTVILM